MNVPLLDLREQNQSLRTEIEIAIAGVLDSNGFILGREVATLEEQLADYCGTRYALTCASGSDAILLALMAVDVGPGDEVITSPYSFFATASSIARLGAVPVFIDIDPATYNIDADQLESRITTRTKAIEPVHLYGQCSDMTAIADIAANRGLRVVEDAAQAIGAEHFGIRAGAMSDVGCFSFYPSKNLGGMGDGGFVTTNDDGLAKKLSALRVHGSEEKYHHKYIGINSRLDSLQAAVLGVKLPRLEQWTERRRENARRYTDLFAGAGLTEKVILPTEQSGLRHIYNQYVVRVPGVRDELRSYLTSRGVGSDIYYPVPLHLQECFAYLGYSKGDLPESERASHDTLALPIYPELKAEQQEYVVDCIAEFID